MAQHYGVTTQVVAVLSGRGAAMYRRLPTSKYRRTMCRRDARGGGRVHTPHCTVLSAASALRRLAPPAPRAALSHPPTDTTPSSELAGRGPREWVASRTGSNTDKGNSVLNYILAISQFVFIGMMSL